MTLDRDAADLLDLIRGDGFAVEDVVQRLGQGRGVPGWDVSFLLLGELRVVDAGLYRQLPDGRRHGGRERLKV